MTKVLKGTTAHKVPADALEDSFTDRQVFLLTIYKPRKNRGSGVYLQASHQTSTHKFKDLASAFAYLKGLEDEQAE